jgi:hypothetical protein
VKLPRRQFLHLAAGAAALPTVSRMAGAQAYPSRPVRIVVGFAAAGASDIAARLIGQWLSERLGQQFIIENRAGAGGNIGTECHRPGAVGNVRSLARALRQEALFQCLLGTRDRTGTGITTAYGSGPSRWRRLSS